MGENCRISLFLIIFSGVALLPRLGVAQQNLFNVPSTEITEENQVFFQQQFNFLSTSTSNTTLDYGLGKGWEIGINLFDVTLYAQQNQWLNPLFLLNFQKGFELTENWRVGIGSQSGPTLPLHQSHSQFASFNYLNNAVDLGKWGKYYLGAYYANQGYVGDGDKINLMAGVDVPLSQDIHLMGDFIGGNNAISSAVAGLVWQAATHWQLSIGAQLPTPAVSSHEYGVVFEITRL